MTLEVYVMVNRHQGKVLFDTGTMGDNLISGKFISINRITIENLEVSIYLKMAVKGSRSTIKYRLKLIIQIDSELAKITEGLVTSLENYDIILGMPYLNRHQAVSDCGKATIMFPNTDYELQY
jgi:hypothetical protein